MAQLKHVLKEIEKRLSRGDRPEKIAKELGVPVHWVTETEMDMEWTGFPIDFQPIEK